ncbi:hypothetical protein SAMN05660690_4075 [Geodermatophilus telluris]|uniref:Uncharacterized protein n=1 Tax=Geodermatophilus telluris TaxID=1190417 RepID=A0A1G6U6B4_9ACTN|nr:hypothetical protein SAMN05660690_4075 [Geodermatophilus telluris]
MTRCPGLGRRRSEHHRTTDHGTTDHGARVVVRGAVHPGRYRVFKKLALAAAAAGALAALRRRSGGAAAKGEADLWHEATSGPQAVSRPTTG